MDHSISRAAKDLVQKMIADVFQSSLTEWHGLTDMRIVATRPSAVPFISVQEHLLDRVFELADHSLLHLEFQSTRERNLYRFYRYAVALTLQYQQPVRTVVIYLAPVRDAPTRLGSVDYTVRNVSIAEKDGHATWERLLTLSPEAWSERDVMDLAFFPFMDDPRSQGERAILATQLAGAIPGGMGRLASALIVGLTSSLVDPEVLKSMKEVIRMNDLITELEQEAIERGWKRGLERGLERGLAQGLAQGIEAGTAAGKAEGRAEGHVELLLEVMSARFGELPADVTTHLKSLTDAQRFMVARKLWSVESLEALAELWSNEDP